MRENSGWQWFCRCEGGKPCVQSGFPELDPAGAQAFNFCQMSDPPMFAEAPRLAKTDCSSTGKLQARVPNSSSSVQLVPECTDCRDCSRGQS